VSIPASLEHTVKTVSINANVLTEANAITWMEFVIAYRAGVVITVKSLVPRIRGALSVNTSASVLTTLNVESLMVSAFAKKVRSTSFILRKFL
jgi:hypothetical protein